MLFNLFRQDWLTNAWKWVTPDLASDAKRPRSSEHSAREDRAEWCVRQGLACRCSSVPAVQRCRCRTRCHVISGSRSCRARCRWHGLPPQPFRGDWHERLRRRLQPGGAEKRPGMTQHERGGVSPVGCAVFDDVRRGDRDDSGQAFERGRTRCHVISGSRSWVMGAMAWLEWTAFSEELKESVRREPDWPGGGEERRERGTRDAQCYLVWMALASRGASTAGGVIDRGASYRSGKRDRGWSLSRRLVGHERSGPGAM